MSFVIRKFQVPNRRVSYNTNQSLLILLILSKITRKIGTATIIYKFKN